MTKAYEVGCNKLIAKGKYQEAIVGLEFILKTNAAQASVYRSLATCHENLKNWREAIINILKTLGHGSYQADDLLQLINILEKSELRSYLPALNKPLTLALSSPTLEFYAIPLLWKQLTHKYPKVLQQLNTSFNDEISQLLQDPVFCLLLERSLINDYFTENLILLCRKEMLSQLWAKKNIEKYQPFLASLACTSLLNDGLYYTDETDKAFLSALNNKKALTSTELLVLINYSSFDTVMTLWQAHQALLQADLFKNIRSDLQLYCQAASSQDKGDITQATSKVVQSFYMENPYPKWKNIKLKKNLQPDTASKKNVLIAGCGTGKQLVSYALEYPKHTITAIDLSPTSLTFAKLMTQKYNITNINFQIMDILNVADLSQSFDLIMSTGVIHHMSSPLDGLMALSKVLSANGRILLGLYSSTARKDLQKIKRDILTFLETDEANITREGVKQWRAQISNEYKKKPVCKMPDFFYLNGLYDLLFHPQQTEYTLIEVEELLEQCGLSFDAMNVKNNTQLEKSFCNTPMPLGERNLNYWHKIESEYPYTFISMYNFLASKIDNT